MHEVVTHLMYVGNEGQTSDVYRYKVRGQTSSLFVLMKIMTKLSRNILLSFCN